MPGARLFSAMPLWCPCTERYFRSWACT
jgi:hypothetical protein